jgi:hypothetical protein
MNWAWLFVVITAFTAYWPVGLVTALALIALGH